MPPMRSSKYVEDGGIEPQTLGLQITRVWSFADLAICG